MLLLLLLCALHASFAVPDSQRIVGGRTASKGQYPYQVSVRDRSVSKNYNHKCGGVIIGQQDILTAAQCVRDVDPSDIYIVAGTTSISIDTDDDAIVVYANKIKIHPSYNSNTKKGDSQTYNDLAIIKLEKRLPTRHDIQPADLLSYAPDAGAMCSVSGWGVTNGSAYIPNLPTKLRAADVYFVPNGDCRQRLMSVQEDELCAEPTGSRAEGACDLDNGGPLYCDGGLLGIYSWSDTYCGTADSPGVYSSVPYHYDWIVDSSDRPRTTTRRGGKTTAGGPGRTTAPGGGSPTRAPPAKADQPDTCLILGVIEVILICVILLVLFVLVAIVKK